jgi:4-hydroxythreonine-4-phosphate dehydrogenase
MQRNWQERAMTTRPLIAFALGDPAGISPEITARVMADRTVSEIARVVVFGDARILRAGAETAGLVFDHPVTRDLDEAIDKSKEDPAVLDTTNCDPARVPRGDISDIGGISASDNFRQALALAGSGRAKAVCFSPFNKASMRRANPGYDDEIRFVADAIGFHGTAKEFNVLEGLWNARVTSHVPLKDVAGLLTRDSILENLRLTDGALRASGLARPRIAVAGLNPHAGDHGNFGTEEIDTIGPAVAAGKSEQIVCDGPFPADTVFVRARRGDFDAVLTMYHDQGQIAMKLIGFDAGVTLLGGFPFPICTAAHGTAFDIAGKGIAAPHALANAVALAARMASVS